MLVESSITILWSRVHSMFWYIAEALIKTVINVGSGKNELQRSVFHRRQKEKHFGKNLQIHQHHCQCNANSLVNKKKKNK